MRDDELVEFLQWALPKMELRWAGFRKVRKQVRKRLAARLRELKVRDLAAYRRYLAEHADEWDVLDAACRITISSFYRDQGVFDVLRDKVLPVTARRAAEEGREVAVWSAGAASGEEPFTVALIWSFCIEDTNPGTSVRIVATEINDYMLERAEQARFPASSVRDLPTPWLSRSFDVDGDEYQLRESFRERVEFLQQDIRLEMPRGEFDLIACRNLVFTYFAPELQRQTLARLEERVRRGGYLVIGNHEALPRGASGWLPQFAGLPIYRRLR